MPSPAHVHRLVLAAVCVACALQPRHAEARGASTPEERARFIALVQSLEREPLAANANATRQQLRDWTIEVPDIRFKACPDLLADVIGNDYPYSREINLQVVLTGAVLTIENPGEASRMAADPPGHLPDRHWNVRCGHVDDRRRRDAGFAAAGFPFPVTGVALNRRRPLGAGDSWPGSRAESTYDMNLQRERPLPSHSS
jgi:hypothetical protein